MVNELERALKNLLPQKQENSSLALIAGQNHLGLDTLTLQQGGVCAVIQTPCCANATNLDKSNTMSRAVSKHSKTLHQIAIAPDGFSLSDLFRWIPSLNFAPVWAQRATAHHAAAHSPLPPQRWEGERKQKAQESR